MFDKRLPLDHFFQEGMRERLAKANLVEKLISTIQMLNDCATGKIKVDAATGVEHAPPLTKMQIEAAKATLVGLKIGLAKIIPDLQSTTLSSADGGALTIQVVQFARDEQRAEIGDSENTRLRLAPAPTSN
jgi:hypothetical protein